MTVAAPAADAELNASASQIGDAFLLGWSLGPGLRSSNVKTVR